MRSGSVMISLPGPPVGVPSGTEIRPSPFSGRFHDPRRPRLRGLGIGYPYNQYNGVIMPDFWHYLHPAPADTPPATPPSTPPAAPPPSYPDYALADRQIKRMIDNIQTCQIPSTSVIPMSMTLSPPDGNAPASVVAAYDSYSLRLAEFEQAKRTAGVYCSAGTNPGSGPGVQYGTPSCGFDAYGRQLPCGQYRQIPTSAISPNEVDLYPSDPVQADIYTRDVATQRNYPEGGTDIVTNPYAPQPPPAAPPPKKKPKAAIYAAGGVALLAVALLARKRGSRSRRRRSP